VARDNTLKVPCINGLGIPSHITEIKKISTQTRRSAEYARLVLGLTPDEVPVKLGVGVELLGEEPGLALLGPGVLFFRGQVEDQVGDDEGL